VKQPERDRRCILAACLLAALALEPAIVAAEDVVVDAIACCEDMMSRLNDRRRHFEATDRAKWVDGKTGRREEEGGSN
jgi:hypothetical protein